jgi:hypothetical protein
LFAEIAFNDALGVKWIAYGTGTTAATIEDTDLESETGSRRYQTSMTLDSTNNVAQIQFVIPASVAATIRELGAYNASSGDYMFYRDLLTASYTMSTGKNLKIKLEARFN